MRLELICTGAELIDGRIVDSNTKLLAGILREAGLEFSRVTLVGDGLDEIAAALRDALARAEIVLVSGGLGPTVDDLTRDAAARVLGVPLIEDEASLAELQRKFALLGRRMMDNNRRQAMFPLGATILPNPMGTAAGFVCEKDGRLAVFVPGVPFELEYMAREHILPLVARRAGSAGVIVSVTLKTFGQTESGLDSLLALLDLGEVRLAFTAVMPEVHITLTATGADREEASAKLQHARALVEKNVGEAIFADDRRTMEEVVAGLMIARNLKLAVAESCTGGMIAARLTNVPGSSNWFLEGAVTYSNPAKVKRLGVSEKTIKNHGAVSEETAREMAEGLRATSGADLALSVTGVAGPSGGSAEKPVGTVYMALASPTGTRVWHNVVPGDRRRVRSLATEAALDRLRRWLLSWPT